MRYLEVGIRCHRAACDAVGNMIAEMTGTGYAVDDPLDIVRNRDSWDATDLVAGDPAWVTVKGWFSEAGDLEQTQMRVEQELEAIRRLGLGVVEAPVYAWVQDEDWANNWKAYFRPTRVGRRLVVVPSWEEYQPEPEEVILHLDPGMAFGTGTHPTTGLCLRWLEELVQSGDRVIDIGTGSGILALAASKLGAEQVLAVDVDPVAVKVARENADRNGVPLDIRQGTIDQMESDQVDLVVANIIASVIIDVLPHVVQRMKKGSKFLASGIIAEKKQAVVDAMVDAWLLPTEVREEGGWVAILATKP